MQNKDVCFSQRCFCPRRHRSAPILHKYQCIAESRTQTTTLLARPTLGRGLRSGVEVHLVDPWDTNEIFQACDPASCQKSEAFFEGPVSGCFNRKLLSNPCDDRLTCKQSCASIVGIASRFGCLWSSATACLSCVRLGFLLLGGFGVLTSQCGTQQAHLCSSFHGWESKAAQQATHKVPRCREKSGAYVQNASWKLESTSLVPLQNWVLPFETG